MINDLHGMGALAPYLPPFTPGEDGQRWHFDSLEEMVRTVPNKRPASAWSGTAWESGDNWHGTNTYAESVQLALNGWTAGAERVQRIASRIAMNRPHAARIARWDVAGAVASVPRHLAGNPLAMRRLDARETSKRPVITLVADIAAAASVEPQKLTLAAAIAAAITDRLEEAGFRVEIIAACRTSDDRSSRDARHAANRQGEVALIAKRAEDPADPARLSFALGHAGMFRRFVFAAYFSGKPVRYDGWGVGLVQELQNVPNRPEGVFIVPSAQSMPAGEMEAYRYALRILREQGCPGIPEDEAAVA